MLGSLFVFSPIHKFVYMYKKMDNTRAFALNAAGDDDRISYR